ncbi:MAG: hypothetical protein JRM99_07750 [Nitrososphaerota archaeon]|nr:hypothetical protein [Nitrososphaerota archaeon]
MNTHGKAVEKFAAGGRGFSLPATTSLPLMDALGVETSSTFDRRSFGSLSQRVSGVGYSKGPADDERDKAALSEKGGAEKR